MGSILFQGDGAGRLDEVHALADAASLEPVMLLLLLEEELAVDERTSVSSSRGRFLLDEFGRGAPSN